MTLLYFYRRSLLSYVSWCSEQDSRCSQQSEKCVSWGCAPGPADIRQLLTDMVSCGVQAPPIQSPASPRAQPQQGEKRVAYS